MSVWDYDHSYHVVLPGCITTILPDTSYVTLQVVNITVMATVNETIATDKFNCYRGIARVPLESLHFQHPLVRETHREESPKNIRRLERIFEASGCLRLEDENVINAVVEDADLALALNQASLTADDLKRIRAARDAPVLHLKNVKCLMGLHRIRAADRYLDANDKWWTVRIFTSGNTKYEDLCSSVGLIPWPGTRPPHQHSTHMVHTPIFCPQQHILLDFLGK